MLNKIAPVRVHSLIASPHRDILCLDGVWNFALDPENRGLDENWQNPSSNLEDNILVPGCLEGQGKGVTYIEPQRPNWAGTSDVPYFGVSWYQKTFEAPKKQAGKRTMLNFGGVSTSCTIYLNGQMLGSHEYGIIPFGYDITEHLKYSQTNVLTLRVENNHHHGTTPTSHHGFGSSTTELKWSGVYRSVEIVQVNEAFIEDIYLKWDGAVLSCCYRAAAPDTYRVRLTAREAGTTSICYQAESPLSNEVKMPMPDAKLWDDLEPNLYDIALELLNEEGCPVDSMAERFGLRVFSYENNRILINGRPIYLRGDMVHFHWPVTVSPPTDREDIRKRLMVYKQFGMNFLRHHTHFPSPEYLDICDEIGLLTINELGINGGSWPIDAEHRTTIWPLAIRRDRNHPAVMIWCMGNETVLSEEDIATYGPLTFENDDTRFALSDSPGWFLFPNGQRERFPVLHEYRMSGGSYIDFSIAHKYEGSALRPWRQMFAEKRLKENALWKYSDRFVSSTQKLQETCRKILLEQARASNVDAEETHNLNGIDYTGFVLCTFRDSGSFVWGTVDDFFDPKCTSPEDFRQYVGETVLLYGQRWYNRVFKIGGFRSWMPIVISCSHFGRRPIHNGVLTISLTDKTGKDLFSHKKEGIEVSCGQLKTIEVTMNTFDGVFEEKYQKLTLSARLIADGIDVHNSWDVWTAPFASLSREDQEGIGLDLQDSWLYTQLIRTYPSINSRPLEQCKVLITDKLSDRMASFMDAGGRVLLTGNQHFPVRVTEFGAARSEYARGTVIFDHPALKNIENDGWCDVPFSGLISDNRLLNGNRDLNGCSYILDESWPEELEPIILAVPSCKDEKPQRMAHLFEVAVGQGAMMASTFKFGSPYCKSQFDYFFLDELLKYLCSNQCAPICRVSSEFILSFRNKTPQVMDLMLRGVNDAALPPKAQRKLKPGQETSDWRNMPPLPEEFEYMLKKRDRIEYQK